jgi:hypothetical protein
LNKPFFQGALNGQGQGLVANRLVGDIGCTEFQGVDGFLHVAMTGDDDYGGVGVPGFYVFQDIDTVHPGHFDIRQNQIGGFPDIPVQPFFAAIGRNNLEAVIAQRHGQGPNIGLFIVDDQYFLHVQMIQWLPVH